MDIWWDILRNRLSTRTFFNKEALCTALWTVAQPVPCSKTPLSCPRPSSVSHVTQNKNCKNKTMFINWTHLPENMSVLWEFPAIIMKVQLKTAKLFDSVNSPHCLVRLWPLCPFLCAMRDVYYICIVAFLVVAVVPCADDIRQVRTYDPLICF